MIEDQLKEILDECEQLIHNARLLLLEEKFDRSLEEAMHVRAKIIDFRTKIRWKIARTK